MYSERFSFLPRDLLIPGRYMKLLDTKIDSSIKTLILLRFTTKKVPLKSFVFQKNLPHFSWNVSFDSILIILHICIYLKVFSNFVQIINKDQKISVTESNNLLLLLLKITKLQFYIVGTYHMLTKLSSYSYIKLKWIINFKHPQENIIK